MDKYLLFEKHFLENELTYVILQKIDIPEIVPEDLHPSDIVLLPRKVQKIVFEKFNYITEKYYLTLKNSLNFKTKYYFDIQITIWKYLFIRVVPSQKSVVCRICERTFYLKDFILHSQFCMETKILLKVINDVKVKLRNILKILEAYVRDTPIRKEQKTFTKQSKYETNQTIEENHKNLLKNLIDLIKKIKSYMTADYVRCPYKLISLKKFIYQLTKLFNENNKSKKGNKTLNEMFCELIPTLLKNEKALENILFYINEKRKISDYNTDCFADSDDLKNITKYNDSFHSYKSIRNLKMTGKVYTLTTINNIF